MELCATVDLRRGRARHEGRRQTQLLGMRSARARAKGEGPAEQAALSQVAGVGNRGSAKAGEIPLRQLRG
eukprot:581565-Alexandrium_andersonii.AAC.1